MRAPLRYMALSAVAALSFLSCGRKDKVIPRDDMARIYAEMFVLDQKISQESDIRRKADTLLVYEPVFEAYGYTSDDYRASMAYYIKDPDRYVKILKRTVEILETRRKELKAEKALQESMSQSQARTESYRPDRIFFLSGMANRDLLTVDGLSFYIDSTGGAFDFDVQKGYDTLFVGPRIEIISEMAALSDSLAAAGSVPDMESAVEKDATEKSGLTAVRPGMKPVRGEVSPAGSPQTLKIISPERR